MGFLPGLLIYVVSYQFVSRSIESWFDVKVEGALDAGLSLGRATLDTLANDLANKTRAAACAAGRNAATLRAALALERLREQLPRARPAAVERQPASSIASAGQSRFQLNPERPTPQQLRNVRAPTLPGHDRRAGRARPARRRQRAHQGAGHGAASSLGPGRSRAVLQVTQSAAPRRSWPTRIAVQEANREYQERALAREGLRRMYIGTLTLSLFLAVFGAVLLAVILGNQLARPLLLLAAGVREVAAGDLSPKPALQGKDELGGLTRSFAEMTQQLGRRARAVDRAWGRSIAARANLQTILDNLTAGVIVLDDEGNIDARPTRARRASCACRSRPTRAAAGRHAGLARLSARRCSSSSRLHDRAPAARRCDHWQQSFELKAAQPGSPQDASRCVARGARDARASARLLVFDDISESCRPSARRPGARWRGASRTRSRTRSRRSSCRPSACR